MQHSIVVVALKQNQDYSIHNVVIMNSYSAASDMGDIGMGHRSDCILQCLSDDFDQESDSQPPRLDASNVYDADLASPSLLLTCCLLLQGSRRT